MILFLLINLAWALDPKIVESWPECQGQQSQWSAEQIQALKSTHRFLNSGEPLDHFTRNIQHFNDWNKKQTVCHKPKSPLLGGVHKEPHPSVVLVDDLQKNMISKIQKELTVQKNLIENGIVCTSQNPPAKIKSQCDQYLNSVIPKMSQRLQNMRALKSLAARGQSLEHDKPFTTSLYQSFYPSLWKENSTEKLSPLNSNELKLRNDFAKKYTPEQALEAYYGLISTTPTLLFFDDEVNKESLHSAFKNLKEQNHLDDSEILKNPPQELFMMDDYVKEAIKTLPDSQKGDACLVVSEIYRNLKKEYENFPVYLAAVTGLASLGSAPASIFINLARSGSVVYGSITYKNFQTYQRGVAFCSSQAMTDEMLKSKVCNAQGLNNIYDNMQTGAVVSTGVFAGIRTLGLLRMAKGLIKQ